MEAAFTLDIHHPEPFFRELETAPGVRMHARERQHLIAVANTNICSE
jgi:hypothetical protein